MPTFIEVCAGAGGLSTGFINEGFTPLLINELLPVAVETLKLNHATATIHAGSMTELDLTAHLGKVDVLMGGVPCQSFSHAGERKGMDDPRGQLVAAFYRLVTQCRPKLFFIENVKGLTTHAKGETLQNILTLFRSDGYDVSFQVLNAVDFGVPQKRERVFIVGAGGTFEFPRKTEAPWPTLRRVLEDVPESDGAKYTESKKAVMKLVPPGGCWVDLPKDVKEAYMGNCLKASGGKRGMARRLSMDEPCLTLTTSPAQKQTERCHPTEDRPFTVREYARIQTFPDDYVFAGSVAAQYKQIGNAVPVKLAEAVARSVRQKIFSI